MAAIVIRLAFTGSRRWAAATILVISTAEGARVSGRERDGGWARLAGFTGSQPQSTASSPAEATMAWMWRTVVGLRPSSRRAA
jgi:hypothetical protein